MSFMPKAAARSATSWPMLPVPKMPSVLSCSSLPVNLERSHLPAFMDAVAGAVLRATESMSLIRLIWLTSLAPASQSNAMMLLSG